MPASPPDSEGERIYLPGWVKPSVALALALMGAGATAGWVGANYARSTDDQIKEVRTGLRDTQRELCALRQALNVTSYTVICGSGQLSVSLSAKVSEVSWVEYLQVPGPDLPATAVVSILAGLSVGLFILGAAGFLVCWTEILRVRKRVHQHDTHLTALFLKADLEPPEPKP